MNFPKYAIIILLLTVLLLGFFLRIYDLDTKSIWLDEGISIKLSRADPAAITIERALNNHPPLYFIILHYWVRAFGNSVFSARLLSVLFGLLAIFMIYRVGCLVFNRETGLLSSLILALSLFNIHYSREVRMYGLLVFLTLVSMYFFLKLLKKRSRTNLIGYITACIFLLYTHYSGLYVVLAQNIYFATAILLYKKKGMLDIKAWIKYQAVLFILYLPWLWVGVLRMWKIQESHFWVGKSSVLTVFGSFIEYSGSIALFVIFLILLLFLAVSVKKYRKELNLPDAEKMYLLSLWLAVPIAVPFVISQFAAPMYMTKYTMPAQAAFCLFIAISIGSIRRRYAKVIIIGAIALISLFNIGQYYKEINTIPWNSVAKYVEENAKPHDMLIFNDPLCTPNTFNYYFKRDDIDKRLFVEKGSNAPFTQVNEKNIKILKQLARGRNRVWIILAHTVDSNEIINETFGKSYKTLYHRIYLSRSYVTHKINNVIEVFLLERR